MRLKEKYPKNVSFYLEEKNKNHFSLHFMFLDEQLNIQNGRNLSKNQKQKVDKRWKKRILYPGKIKNNKQFYLFKIYCKKSKIEIKGKFLYFF